ncbi:PaaI family thioesterase [Streptomyces sp. NPDC057193]|uniref:PaaI family thioesterase n=1 Tax=unclassified Streptomyces TaxID=2593676 RepID=UPI00093ADF84|nr:PaaI family thioesterase [Streptomyces sp. CB02261]OKJ64041.1 aromatic compound degradation protein PaaI [Streptomyces sp. CB02261]
MGRSRTVEWEDAGATARAAGTMAGLDFLREMVAGRLPGPPIAALIGFSLEEVEDGRAVFVLEPGEEHYNPIGSVHGGVYATLLDSAAGCAVHSTLPQGTAYTSLDLSTRFLRPLTTATGKVRAIGTVLSRGRRTALAEAALYDAEDRLLAHATSTCMLFPVPAEGSGATRA